MIHYRDKLQLLRYLFANWIKIKERKEHYQSDYIICEASKDFDMMMKRAFERLNNEERTIINKLFLESDHSEWWREFYSRSTYYRLKHRSVDAFIHCLHDKIMIK